MPMFEVRTNCEFINEVEAADADEAIAVSQSIDVMEWSQTAWSGIEAEKIGD